MEHTCPDCHRTEDTEEAYCELHIKAGQFATKAKEALIELWGGLKDGFGRREEGQPKLVTVLTYLEAYRQVGLLGPEEAELWEMRIRHKCPGHLGEGGRVWCAYCGDIKPDPEEGPAAP